jgi:hypothetical protein
MPAGGPVEAGLARVLRAMLARHRQRICHKTSVLTQTFDFAWTLSHCALSFTGINFANFTQRPLTVP